jgi:hypothetical protein
MDQGIIASFKLQYRKQWVAFMIREHEAQKNPQKTVNLLKAIQWVRVSWEQSVTPTTIKKCWWKSTLIEPSEEPREEDNQVAEQAELQAQIAQLPIENFLSLHEFLTPNDEMILDEDDDIFESVVEHYSIDLLGNESSDEEEEEIEEVNTAEALKCVELLKLWKLQRGNSQDLQALDRLEREIVRYKSSTATQTTIHRFFRPVP